MDYWTSPSAPNQSGLVRPIPSAWFSVHSRQSNSVHSVPVSGRVPVRSGLCLCYGSNSRLGSGSEVGSDQRQSSLWSSFIDPKIKAIQTKAQSYKRKAQSLPWSFPYSKTICLKTLAQNAKRHLDFADVRSLVFHNSFST